MNDADRLGGVKVPTIVDCPRCASKVIIPPGLVLRVPGNQPYWCHETVDPFTGVVYRRGQGVLGDKGIA